MIDGLQRNPSYTPLIEVLIEAYVASEKTIAIALGEHAEGDETKYRAEAHRAVAAEKAGGPDA